MVKFDVKRTGDDEWIPVGEVEMANAEAATEAEVTPILDHILVAQEKDMEHSYPVTWPEAYYRWSLDVDTTELADSLDVNSDAARALLTGNADSNPYMVRATAIAAADGTERSVPDVTAMFSVDNDDDVAPIGPTNIVASSINDDAMDMVFEDNGDGTYTIGALVDKYDTDNVKPPIVTFTITPTAARTTYASVKLMTNLPEGAVIGQITETEADSGVFTVTVNIGILMDEDDMVHNDVYLANGAYMFHALAYDKAEAYNAETAADEMFAEYGNIQADTYDDDEITVNVANTYRPAPGVVSITVDNSDMMTNADSGAPQGELTLNAYSHNITSPPTEEVRFEVKRSGDEAWIAVGTASESTPVTKADADIADVLNGLVGITENDAMSGEESETDILETYQKWSIAIDTVALGLEDTIARGDAAQPRCQVR